MKKKILHVALSLTIISAIVSCAHTSQMSKENEATTRTTISNGKHCNGTVGCDCSGFAPKTNGDVWEQAYCKHCGHKKSSHK